MVVHQVHQAQALQASPMVKLNLRVAIYLLHLAAQVLLLILKARLLSGMFVEEVQS
jgi:hypothetical protein